MGKKRVNPRRKLATQADVKRAKEEAVQFGVNAATAIILFVMREKFGWGKKRLTRLWEEIDSLSEETLSGEVKLDEIVEILEKEYQIHLE